MALRLKLLEDTTSLTALVIPLGAAIGAAVNHLIAKVTIATFKPGEGLYMTLIEPVHLDDVVGMLIFGVLAFVGYRVKNTILMLFGLSGLAGVIADEVTEALKIYYPY